MGHSATPSAKTLTGPSHQVGCSIPWGLVPRWVCRGAPCWTCLKDREGTPPSKYLALRNLLAMGFFLDKLLIRSGLEKTWKQLFPGTQMLPRWAGFFGPSLPSLQCLCPQSDPTLWSNKRWQPLRASGTAQRKRASNCYQGLQVHRNRLLIINV